MRDVDGFPDGIEEKLLNAKLKRVFKYLRVKYNKTTSISFFSFCSFICFLVESKFSQNFPNLTIFIFFLNFFLDPVSEVGISTEEKKARKILKELRGHKDHESIVSSCVFLCHLVFSCVILCLLVSSCVFLYHLVSSCVILHYFVLSSVIFRYLPLSSVFFRYLA